MLSPCLLAAVAAAAEVHVLDVRGAIGPGTADYVVEGIRAAEDADAVVLIRLDTPGGLLASARAIVQAELGAEVPVVVHVTPTGARAASAGMFVTMAGHVAVMAPGTTIGAATPVALGGEQEAAPVDAKVLEDTAAWARTIAAHRGRDAAWAERAVREAAAATETEAVQLGVVDLVAGESVLQALDGREVTVGDRTVTLATANADVVEVPMTMRQRVVHALADPNLLFFFVTLGVLGVYIELMNPGMVVPGAIGIILLLAAAVGLSILPFNAAGLALLIGGAVLLGLEVFVASGGALAITGVGALVLGGLLLFERVPGFDLRVDPRNLVGVAGVAGLVALGLAVQVARAQQRRVTTGMEGLLGAEAVVLVGGEGGGRVRVEGEDWAARWPGTLTEGAPARVVAVHGLRLDVEPLQGGVS